MRVGRARTASPMKDYVGLHHSEMEVKMETKKRLGIKDKRAS